ncbi:MAG: DUF4301 family protein [Acidobacteriota bacterium]
MTSADFATADLDQLAALGISRSEAERQLAQLRHPPSPIRLDRPCRLDDGIARLPEGDAVIIAAAEEAIAAGRVSKMVPASGAASRMFKALQALRDGGEATAETDRFFDRLDDLPFAEELRQATGGDDRAHLLEALLAADGLALAARPKALIPFHRDGDGQRTAFEEHLVESTRYTRDAAGRCRLHFTVQANHQPAFADHLAAIRPRIEQSGTTLDVSFSHQHPSTDTLALDPASGRAFRRQDGRLLLRPGGHGALIENLAELAGNLVVIKNIDNVLPGETGRAAGEVKTLLIGRAAHLQRRVFQALEALERGENTALERALDLLTGAFGRKLPEAFESLATEEQRQALIDRLDRPLRVTGVVQNTGEPGGGPYWVVDSDGGQSVQLVEASQIAPEQKHLMTEATHFNPVDLVCAVRDRKGRPYDLSGYIDPATAFVADKSHAGRPLRALERPGLWNGAMAGWNTAFVEVPNWTFAPVKTVMDLLRLEHQGP